MQRNIQPLWDRETLYPDAQDLNVVALVKDTEKYIYLYDEESKHDLLQQLEKDTGDQDLHFTWYDAAVLSQKVCHLAKEALQEHAQREAEQDNG
ncbi:hypothetical protein EXS65_02595 [Candidatus Peribacteria bacterium]|nr:hypothetical protein [Candidatus Peribacteria bacterium]